jgi:hypothetical protein
LQQLPARDFDKNILYGFIPFTSGLPIIGLDVTQIIDMGV